MIKVGIYGSASLVDPVRKQLLRLLLRHPDVDLRAVASPAGNTMPLAELHPVFAGETDLRIERVLDLEKLDVLFVIDEENLSDAILDRFHNDTDFKLIVLGKTTNLVKNPGDMVYGLPEYFRKSMVRGARASVAPKPEAMAIELALLPLAKNALLNSDISVEIASPAIIDGASDEARFILAQVQPSMSARISASARPKAPFGRIDLRAALKMPIAIEEIERIYSEAYNDHNFVYIIAGHGGIDEDLRGSNKCLIQLSKEGDILYVEASLDSLTKGCTGNAVHIMDLIFGLHERTGLSI